MSAFNQVAVAPNSTIDQIIAVASQSLSTQGYEVRAQIVSPTSAELFVTKDRDGIKNIVGMGVECHSSIALVAPGQLSVTTDSVWTNKIIAMAVGWFLCWVPFITGIIGCVAQNDLPKKITTALSLAGSASVNQGYAPQAPVAPVQQAPMAPPAAPVQQPPMAPPAAPVQQAPVAPAPSVMTPPPAPMAPPAPQPAPEQPPFNNL